MIAYFIPFERIGDFEIGSDLSEYKKDIKFEYSPADNSTGWETYSIEDEGISLYVEDNKITSIACDQECLYKGRNIIGISIDEFINLSGLEPEDEIDEYQKEEGILQRIFEFDEIGLQVWCENDIIVTVIASPCIEDEE